MNYKIVTAVALSIAAAAALIVWDPGRAGAQRTKEEKRVLSISGDGTPVLTERLTDLLESTGLAVDRDSLLPRRVSESISLTIQIGSAGATGVPSAPRNEVPVVSLLSLSPGKGPLSRLRSLELATDRIVIFATDTERNVRWWDVQGDPRILRAETADARGNISGKTFYRSGAELTVSIPADRSITSVHLFQPEWNGTDAFTLIPLGEIDVP